MAIRHQDGRCGRVRTRRGVRRASRAATTASIMIAIAIAVIAPSIVIPTMPTTATTPIGGVADGSAIAAVVVVAPALERRVHPHARGAPRRPAPIGRRGRAVAVATCGGQQLGLQALATGRSVVVVVRRAAAQAGAGARGGIR